MRMVFRARQRGPAREVAIKLLSAGQWAPEDLLETLRREAQHAARLQHPNIVIVHGIGERAGLVYYAMQLVRGRSLSQKLDAEGPMPPRDAARLLRTIAEAVDYAHHLGVLHLDLKPGNLLIDVDGVPRISDFGLARPLNQVLEYRHVSGTPSYMAPEQARPDGGPLSPATDVWALGAVLYEMLTGHPPFESDDPARTLQLLQEGTVRRPSRLVAVPEDLEAICLRCLRKDPAERYPTARALADELGRYLEGRAVGARPLRAGQRISRWALREPRLAATAACAVLLLLAGIAATTLQWRRAEHNAGTARELLWNTRLSQAWEKLTTEQPLQTLDPLLANLREQAHAGAAREARESRIRIAMLLAQSPQLIDLLPAGQSITAVAFDPAGHRVAIGTERGQVQLFDARDGSRRWVAETADASHFWATLGINVLAFTRDGRSLVAGRPWSSHAPHPTGQDQVLIDLDTGRVRVPPDARCPGFVDASYSLGGYAVIRCRDGEGRRWARLVRTEPDWTALGPLRRIADSNPLWQLSDATRQVAQKSDARYLELSRPGSLETGQRVALPEGTALRAWSFSPDGAQLALGLDDGRLWLVDARSGRYTVLPAQSSASVAALSYGTDSRWLAVTRDNGQAEVWDVATARTLADPVRHGDGPCSASVDRASGTLLTADARSAKLWQLPRYGGDTSLLAVVPVGSPHYGGVAWYGAAAYHPAQNLLATRQADGQARLWRVRPLAAALPFKPPPLLVDHAFDGWHVFAGDGWHVQARDYKTLRPTSASLAFPQPAGLTLPLADGSGVLVASGHEVHLRNLPAGSPRWPQVDIDNTPVRLLENPAGGSWVATHLAARAGRSVEVIELFSSADGKRIARKELPGPLDGVRFAATGKQLLAWRRDALHVLDGRTLQTQLSAPAFDAPVATAPLPPQVSIHSPDTTLISDVALDADGDTLWLSTLETTRPARLFALDARSARTLRAWATPGIAMKLFPLSQGRLALQTQDDGPFLFDRTRGFHALSTDNVVAGGVAAISADGERLAAATTTAVVVYELAHGRMLTPPLRFPAMKPGDRATQLLLDAHGEHLLARTLEGRWFRWSLEPEATSVAELQQQSDWMQSHDSAAATAEQRARLRARDAGPRDAPEPPAAYAMPATALEPRFVDLRPACDRHGILGWPKRDVVLASHWPVFPRGRLRLLGEDYEVQCAIDVQMLSDFQGPDRFRNRIDGLTPALPRFAALHVLMTGETSLQDRAISPYAVIELHYRDGSRARLSAFYRRDVLPWWAQAFRPPEPVPALLGRENDWQGNGGGLRPLVYGVVLRNPHPEREVADFSLEATTAAWSRPAVLAITLDPPAASMASGPTSSQATRTIISRAPNPRAAPSARTTVAAASRTCTTAAAACRRNPQAP
jgi:WD40 repeat protein